MKQARQNLLVKIVLVALVAPGSVAGRDSMDDGHGGALLETVIEHYQRGELEPAWEAYRQFFSHPSNRNVEVEAFGNCFYRQQCPNLGTLGFILGKSEAEAGDFGEFCPDWEASDTSDFTAQQIAEARELLRAFRTTALGGTCSEWAHATAMEFHSHPDHERPRPQVVPLKASTGNDARPHAEVTVLGLRVTALLDTGASTPLLNRRMAEGRGASVENIGTIPAKYATHRSMVMLARIDSLQLGNELFQRPVVGFADRSFTDGGESVPAELGNVLGMNLLLQYEKVCFDWIENRLHLGDIAHCAQGVSPYRSWLTGSQGIAMDAAVASHGFVQAKIDTGAARTRCSKSFIEQNNAERTFAFGRNPELTGTCTYNPEILFGEWNDGEGPSGNQVLLGMDTLKKFAAFGWRLNPLEVYFTPMVSD